MAKVVRENIDNLNAILTVTIEKADYEPKFNAELGKYKKKAHMKGFRKGKTPMSVVKKMYGKGVLAEVINEKLQTELSKYLTDNKVDILGQPLPNDGQEQIEFDLKQLEDYEFRFDLGIAPEFEVEGVSSDIVYEKLEVETSEEEVEKQLNQLRKQHGIQGQVEDAAQEEDILKLKAIELAGGGIPKPDGMESEFSLMVSRIGNENVKAEVLGKSPGESFRANLLDLEEGIDEAYARKYYLQIEEEDAEEVALNDAWELTILEITRLKPADLDQEFFEKAFGPDEVDSEEAAREKIKENLAKSYENQAESLLFRDFQDTLMEKNEFSLPDNFLNRWILASNEEADPDQIEKEYPHFAKNLKWTLIKNKLSKRFEIKLEEADIKEAFRQRIMGYFGGSPYANSDFIDNMVERLMGDEQQYNQVAEELVTDKLFDAIKGVVTVNAKPVSLEAFEKIVEEAKAIAAKAQQIALDTGEEE